MKVFNVNNVAACSVAYARDKQSGLFLADNKTIYIPSICVPEKDIIIDSAYKDIQLAL